MSLVCKYLALHVPDLRSAEGFYRWAFGMDLLFRESEREGEWWTLPPDKDWDDASQLEVTVGMVALGRDRLVLALFPGVPGPGTVYEICLGVPSADIERLAAFEGVKVLESRPSLVRFEDPFGFRWVLQQPDAVFRSSGEIAGRWLDI